MSRADDEHGHGANHAGSCMSAVRAAWEEHAKADGSRRPNAFLAE
jgi:hypothetical protein